jgi:uncharacterized membrane protein
VSTVELEHEDSPRRGRHASPSRSRIAPWLTGIIEQPSRFVFVAILIAGLSIAILTPPLRGADERDHFVRASQMATGDFSVHRQGSQYGAMLPAGYEAQILQLTLANYQSADRTSFLHLLGQHLAGGKMVFREGGTVAAYGPGAYWAYLPPIAIGRALGLSIAMLNYLARLCGLLAYACIISLAVRRAPVHKWVFVAAALIPEALNQASTVSADGMTAALTALVIANALRLSQLDRDPDLPVVRILVESAIAAFLLALSKPPYIAFVLLFLIPAWKYRARLLVPLAATIFGSLAISGLWLEYQRSHSNSLDAKSQSIIHGNTHQYAFRDIHIPAQTHDVLVHPTLLPTVMWHTALMQGLALPEQMFGLLAVYQISPWLVLASVIVLAIACVVPDDPPLLQIRAVDRVGLLLLTAIIGVAICGIVYITANALHAPRIDQLTPRYFLPLVAPLLVGVLPVAVVSYRRIQSAYSKYIFQVGALLVLVISVEGLWSSFYDTSKPFF